MKHGYWDTARMKNQGCSLFCYAGNKAQDTGGGKSIDT